MLQSMGCRVGHDRAIGLTDNMCVCVCVCVCKDFLTVLSKWREVIT